MEQYYEQVIRTLKEMAKGDEIIPDDESLRLSLLDIYSSKDHKKLGNLVSLLTDVYFKIGEFSEINYVKAFEEAVCDIYKDYKKINEDYFDKNEENMKNIMEFYQDSIKGYSESN